MPTKRQTHVYSFAGADFIMRHMKKPNGSRKCYFSLTQDGRPIKVQRTIFSECFYTMAMSELARATKEEKYKVMYVRKSMYFEQNVLN